MRKVLFVCMFILGCMAASYAQNKQTETVYLKNGSIIKGKVIEMVPGKEIKVQTNDGSLFVYQMDEVDKVVKNGENNPTRNNGSSEVRRPFRFPVDASEYDLQGFRGMVEFAYITGSFDAPELSLSLGYQFNPYFFLGVGAGAQYLSNIEKAGIPIYLDMRGTLFLGKVSPYFALKMGYEKLTDWYVDGGFYCSPVVGVKLMTTRRQAVTLGLGASIFKPEDWSKDNGFTIRLGYEF